MLVGQALQFPELGAFFNMRNLLKVQLQSMMIGSDEVLKTQQQLDQEAAAAAEEEPPPDPEMIKLEIQRQMAQEDGQLQRELAQTKHQTEMMKLAGQHQISLEQLQAQLQGIALKTGSDERKQAQEAAIEGRRDDLGVDRGSGGTF